MNIQEKIVLTHAFQKKERSFPSLQLKIDRFNETVTADKAGGEWNFFFCHGKAKRGLDIPFS